MPNYWLGIMAVAFAGALALWIGLVFRAERLKPGPPHDSTPHREVIGGAFAARHGGRQVMPDPGEPVVPESGGDVPRQAGPAPTERRVGGTLATPSQASEPPGRAGGPRPARFAGEPP